MAGPQDIRTELQTLATELRRLEAEYSMFFSGRLPRPPWETRNRVEAILNRWSRGRIQSSAERFRFATLQARYASFKDLWDRGLRAREEGRPGPFAGAGGAGAGRSASRDENRVLHETSFTSPGEEHRKLEALYQSFSEARRTTGETAIPFHRFVGFVRGRVDALQQQGSASVSCRVAVKNGRVDFTVLGDEQ